MLKSGNSWNVIWAVVLCFSVTKSFAETNDAIAMVAKRAVERFPTQVINRPGIMPVGIVEAKVNSKLSNLKTVGLSVDSQFGIAKDFSGQLGYEGLEFNEWQVKNTVNLGLAYNYFGVNHISGSFTFKVPFHVTDDHIVKDLTIGVPLTFYNNVMAGSILGDVFTLNMRPQKEMAFNFNWWYGYQVYGDIWASVSSSLGEIAMKNTKGQATWEAQGFWKKLPLTLDVVYALNHYFDIGGVVGFNDVLKPKDTFVAGLNFAMRGGKLFG